MPRPIAAGVFGMARTSAPACWSAPARNRSVRPAMIETTTVAGPIIGASAGKASAAICGFTAMTIAAAFVQRAGVRIEPHAACGERRDRRRRMRLDHGDLAGARPACSQPSSKAPPILPAPHSTIGPERSRRSRVFSVEGFEHSSTHIYPSFRDAGKARRPESIITDSFGTVLRVRTGDLWLWIPGSASAAPE